MSAQVPRSAVCPRFHYLPVAKVSFRLSPWTYAYASPTVWLESASRPHLAADQGVLTPQARAMPRLRLKLTEVDAPA